MLLLQELSHFNGWPEILLKSIKNSRIFTTYLLNSSCPRGSTKIFTELKNFWEGHSTFWLLLPEIHFSHDFWYFLQRPEQRDYWGEHPTRSGASFATFRGLLATTNTYTGFEQSLKNPWNAPKGWKLDLIFSILGQKNSISPRREMQLSSTASLILGICIGQKKSQLLSECKT